MLFLLLGCILESGAILLIIVPIFIPTVEEFGFDAIWFAALYLIAIETGATSPPLGAALFVMKAVAPQGTNMGDIYKAAIPFLICDFLAIAIVFSFPEIVTWPIELMFH